MQISEALLNTAIQETTKFPSWLSGFYVVSSGCVILIYVRTHIYQKGSLLVSLPIERSKCNDFQQIESKAVVPMQIWLYIHLVIPIYWSVH